MAWTYSSWITETDIKTRETQLRLHIQEVTEAITAKYQSDGTAVDPSVVQMYSQDLKKDLKAVSGGGSQVTRGRVIRV